MSEVPIGSVTRPGRGDDDSGCTLLHHTIHLVEDVHALGAGKVLETVIHPDLSHGLVFPGPFPHQIADGINACELLDVHTVETFGFVLTTSQIEL